MATTALITRALVFPSDPSAGLDVMLFDSTIREQHGFSIAITENPVETGVSMADHAYAKPDTLAMEVVVSDTPLLLRTHSDPPYAHTSVELSRSQGLMFVGEERRSVNAWKAILDKAKSFAVFDVQTGLRLYHNMMFETGSAEQKADSIGVMRATINLRQVTFATTSTVLYPTRGTKAVKRKATPPVDNGKKEAVDADAASKKQLKSWLVELGLPGA